MADSRSDFTGAWIWFHGLQEADEESRPGLWVLAKALTNAVVFSHLHFPPTLALDYNRLRILQFEIQYLLYQAGCRQTLTHILKALGWKGKTAKGAYADLFSRVAVLVWNQGLQYDYSQRRDSVALEVVRVAYAVCSNRELPTSNDLDLAEDYLRLCCDPRGPIFEVLRSSLAVELEGKVDDEVCAIGDFTCVQLLRRQFPQQRMFPVQSEVEGLIHIARRIAHIARLHWQIWGPILYEQPMQVVGRALDNRPHIDEVQDSEGSSHAGESNEPDESPRTGC